MTSCYFNNFPLYIIADMKLWDFIIKDVMYELKDGSATNTINLTKLVKSLSCLLIPRLPQSV